VSNISFSYDTKRAAFHLIVTLHELIVMLH